MEALDECVTKIICSIPAAIASCTTYSMAGRSTTVTISLGIDLLAGKKRVPKPATGKIAFLIISLSIFYLQKGVKEFNHYSIIRTENYQLGVFAIPN